MSNIVDQNEIKTSAFLDIIHSVIQNLKENVCQNMYMLTGTYYSENPETSDYHIIPESQLPQIAVIQLVISEERKRRSFYDIGVEKDFNLNTYRVEKPPTFYNFDFKTEIISTSVTESIVIREKLFSYWRNSDYLLQTLAGFEYPFDMEEESQQSLLANFSDINSISASITISQVPVYPDKQEIGKLVQEVRNQFKLGNIIIE